MSSLTDHNWIPISFSAFGAVQEENPQAIETMAANAKKILLSFM
jgi:hypothetical protein